MKCSGLILLSFWCVASSAANPSPSQRLASFLDRANFQAEVGMGADYIENRQVKARVMQWFADFQLTPSFGPTLQGHFYGGFSLGTGTHSGPILSEYAPEREWNLESAYVQWRPYSWVQFRAGAIDQGDDHSPLLASDSTFLSVVQEIDLAPREWGLWPFLKFQQAIPPGDYRRSPIDIERDQGTPSFLAHTLGLKWRSRHSEGRLAATAFSYQGLAGQTAYRSQFMGNSLSTYTESTAQFAYPFRGLNFTWQGHALLGQTLGHLTGLEWQGQYLYNRRAPHRRNTGYALSLGLRLQDSEGRQWVPFVAPFRNESDTAPAFYNSKWYGHNNQRGTLLGLEYRSPKGISMSGLAGSHRVLFPNPYQSDGELVALQLKYRP